MKLVADPRNPAQYFAACGLFELASNRHRDLLSYWSDDALVIDALPDSDFSQLVNDFANAELVPDATWVGDDTMQPFVISNPDADLHIRMDWWERRNGHGNSFWKCFGGRQKSIDAANLLIACSSLAVNASAETLLQLCVPLTGRLGFDPRSAWNPIDTGFSPNDLGAALKAVPTFVFTELLAAIALQCWPFRSEARRGHYSLWTRPLPLSVARVQAASDLSPDFAFTRVKRGQGISCFTYSRPYQATKENLS